MEDLEMATEDDGRILEMIYLSYDEAEPTAAPYFDSTTHQEDISPSSARVSDSRLIKEDTSVQPNVVQRETDEILNSIWFQTVSNPSDFVDHDGSNINNNKNNNKNNNNSSNNNNKIPTTIATKKKQKKTTTHFSSPIGTFQRSAISEWNALPADLKSIQSLKVFKTKLKLFLQSW